MFYRRRYPGEANAEYAKTCLESLERVRLAAVSNGTAIDPHLDALGSSAPQPLAWRTSIGDLLQLVGLTMTLKQRHALAGFLGYTGSVDHAASMSIWLHKELLTRLGRTAS